MVWYEELGFFENPFTVKPTETFAELFGLRDVSRKVLEGVRKGKMIILKGGFGTGKTSILNSVIEEHRGSRKVVYYNAYSSEEKIDFDSLLRGAGGLLSRFFGFKSKNIILLVDEAHKLMPYDFGMLQELYEDGYFKSVVLVTSKHSFAFPSHIVKAVGKNSYSLSKFSRKDAVKLVRDRLEDDHVILPDKIIGRIYDSSDTPRDFLMKCEDACRKAVEKGKKKVAVEDL